MSKTANHIFEIVVVFLPAVVWAGFIYLLSSQQVLPSLAISTWDFVFKKSAHVFSYAVLYILLFRAFHKSAPLSGHHIWLIPLLLTLVYAGFDELHQSLVPSRHGSVRDIGFDALGASLVIMRKFGYI